MHQDDRTNKYGLPRTIPAAVAREVRQRCGFGCVLCGSAIVEYDHVAPPFAEARAHEPDAIALLCPMCHAKKTKGHIATSTVEAGSNNPFAKKAGFAFDELDPSRTPPRIALGGAHFINCPVPLAVSGMPVVRIEEPDEAGGPYLISATFFDSKSTPALDIERNVWKVIAGQWDVTVEGGFLTVREGPGEIALMLRFVPTVGIFVERIKMQVKGYLLEGNHEVLKIIDRNGKTLRLMQCTFQNCEVGMQL